MPNLTAVLTRARTLAESNMADTCSIRRATGQTTNTLTGQVTTTWTPLYTGKCRVQQSSLGASSGSADVGEAAIRLVAFELQLPMTVTGLAEGDQITITASPLDEDLVDRVFTVVGLAHKTHATARRVQIQEVT